MEPNNEAVDFSEWAALCDGWLASIIGADADEAEAELKVAECRYRIRRRDHARMIGTSDLRPDRVNLEIDNGKVTKAYRG